MHKVIPFCFDECSHLPVPQRRPMCNHFIPHSTFASVEHSPLLIACRIRCQTGDVQERIHKVRSGRALKERKEKKVTGRGTGCGMIAKARGLRKNQPRPRTMGRAAAESEEQETQRRRTRRHDRNMLQQHTQRM